MPFESLSYRHTYTITTYPEEWLQFVHLYDADLPLFPLQYFHVLLNGPEVIPRSEDRVFGYVERTHFTNFGLEVTIICNKDLADPHNVALLLPVRLEIEERLGTLNRVVPADVAAVFQPPLDYANAVLVQIWQRVVANVLGNSLPFGRLYDPILGLARFVASWYSPGGRKSEWIQTHYFCSKFGEKITASGNLPKIDFYLLPTFTEVTNPNNPLDLFPKFQALSNAAANFHRTFCEVDNIGGGLTFSRFRPPFTGGLDTAKLMGCITSLGQNSAEPLIECFNAFDKGPMRTVMFLQMFNDTKSRRVIPQQLTSNQFGLIYDSLAGFYQPPKVISLYAQQCFGNTFALPNDTWVMTLMKWPLMIYPTQGGKLQRIFASANNLGKVERLLWIAAQARKVHSSLCDDALWCTKFDSSEAPRGANPLACNACLPAIRNSCPAYRSISNAVISFNQTPGLNNFVIWTSLRNNHTPNQRFSLCEGQSTYGAIHDDFTPIDDPSAFAPFPHQNHQGQPLTVDQFIRMY